MVTGRQLRGRKGMAAHNELRIKLRPARSQLGAREYTQRADCRPATKLAICACPCFRPCCGVSTSLGVLRYVCSRFMLCRAPSKLRTQLSASNSNSSQLSDHQRRQHVLPRKGFRQVMAWMPAFAGTDKQIPTQHVAGCETPDLHQAASRDLS